MTSGSYILAKLHGFDWRNVPDDFGAPGISVNRKAVAKWNFDAAHTHGYGQGDLARTVYNYAPRAYCYGELESVATDNIKKIVAHLDSFPENAGKPIFDHFMVLVPGINFPKATLMKANGDKQKFESIEACNKGIDLEFIAQKVTVPVLLGEREGKCYFICLWE
jgi:hypothetical protein